MFEHYNLIVSCGMRGNIFFRLIFNNKTTSRSYGYFSNLTFLFYFKKNSFSDYVKNYKILPKKSKEV
jgi:hypothetical protein